MDNYRNMQQLTKENIQKFLSTEMDKLSQMTNNINNNEEGDELESVETYETEDTGDILGDATSKINLKNISLIVSSLDRDWYNRTDETPFNFDVKLDGGLQNNYLMVDIAPKNVLGININRMILPNRKTDIGYYGTIQETFNYPYLLINVNDLDYINYGTNDQIDRSLGVMIPSIPIPKIYDEINFMEMKNISGNYGKEYVNPLASLSRLDINITNQLGQTPKSYTDVLDVKCIVYNEPVSSNVATEYLVIQTNTYFPKLEYKNGDTLKFNNYVYRDTGTYSESIDMNNFINRDAGHKIIGISTSDSDKLLNNRIHIEIPNEISTSTGNVGELYWYSQLKTKSMGNVSTISSVNDTSGKLINTNLQTQILFNIKVIEKNLIINEE